ncbi:hypothetical protein [Dysosmobacter sp.]|uniref:hypothetical protein n=1 Tax=Dysosmobacter sp. TaxID=2591382 RepID=UPI003A955748
MKRVATSLVTHLSTLVLLAGAAAVTVGAGMIFLPAGFITGGGLAIAGAILSMWGEDEGK